MTCYVFSRFLNWLIPHKLTFFLFWERFSIVDANTHVMSRYEKRAYTTIALSTSIVTGWANVRGWHIWPRHPRTFGIFDQLMPHCLIGSHLHIYVDLCFLIPTYFISNLAYDKTPGPKPWVPGVIKGTICAELLCIYYNLQIFALLFLFYFMFFCYFILL